jgi:hypothetical protein
MGADTVLDIQIGKIDGMGDPIQAVFGKTSNIYAVYGTPKRVKIQFSDDDTLMLEQRRALAPLNPLRGKIDGMLDEWRKSNRRAGTVAVFDRRTADALTLALQGDQASAEVLLNGVKADIAEEQESIGRRSYLVTATIAALLVFIVFMLLAAQRGGPLPAESASVGMWDRAQDGLAGAASFVIVNKYLIAAGFGALGALFSIAIGIRRRELRPDMQRRDNHIDAILRIMIGVVSAIVLFSLLRSGLVSLRFGQGQAEILSINTVHAAIIVAFVAGFAEMLVGDYISSVVLREKATEPATAAAQQAQREAEANELNPRGRKEFAGGDAVAPAAGAVDPDAPANSPEAPSFRPAAHDHEAGTDACICQATLEASELTLDEELPAASGGVETDKAA